ncbi:MAG: SPOR domain-containing protein [Bacteroidota bacterium]
MAKSLKSFILLLSVGSLSYAQTDSTTIPTSSNPQESPKNEFIFKPTIGLGTGVFSFYGDLYSKHFQMPSVSRIGYDLNVSQRFTDYLQINFYVLFGKLGANERNTNDKRNVNFESQIRVGGLKFEYNFGNFLPKDRTASPFISLGIESFEFLSKTDLYDKNGNFYYYWSDGSIRNLDENDPNADFNTMKLQRDYKYETDIREQNLDGFGKYSERSWAIPVGAGVMFQINDYWDFKIGATMHFSFTDYIDGVTKNSVGDRAGTSQNDNFMMTSVSIHYNLGLKKDADELNEEDPYKDVDFLALENEDQDKDGIRDWIDSCQGTPEGVPVDARGCPLDDDSDGVPNYKDDEPNSPSGAFVDLKGVQLSDSLIAYQYQFYSDDIGAFAKIERHDHTGSGVYNMLQKEYTVQLGVFEKGLAPELMTKFLSISDISSTNINDSTTVYTAGKFNNSLDAEKRKQQLISEGLMDAKVVYKQSGIYYDIPVTNNIVTTPGNTTTPTDKQATTDKQVASDKQTINKNEPPTDDVSGIKGVVLRVQLGAYNKRLSKSVFKNVKDLIEVKTDDGLYKYMSGSFTNFDAAAKYKVDLLLKGYQGAFIAAYKDGKRIPLKEAGATLQKKEDLMEADSAVLNAVDKKLVTFKIQVGVFKNEPPADKKAKFDAIQGLTREATPTGLNRYVVGSFNDYKAAQAYKAELIKNGIEGAFVVAFFNNEYITIQEALELLK